MNQGQRKTPTVGGERLGARYNAQRPVGRFLFTPQPGSGASVRDDSGEMFEVSEADYDAWRTDRKERQNRFGVLG